VSHNLPRQTPRRNGPRYYQTLLLLYPASFRAEYGEEMRAVFTRRKRDADGLPGIAWLWVAALFETHGTRLLVIA
jgi:hypothetical protein